MFNTVTSHQMLQYPPRPMAPMDSRIWKPSVEIAPDCPRCASPNTKFCYYNNYSLSQPRYFCKGCRRYWTKGGSLRNVPVGGGCRKTRRSRPAKSERVRFNNYVRNTDPTPNGSPDRSDDHGSMANIDIAEVFAKYLNQNSEQKSSLSTEDSSSGASCGSVEVDPTTQLEKIMMMERNTPFDSSDYLFEEAQFNQIELPRIFVGEDNDDIIQDFMSQHPNLLELHEMLNEELPENMSWKDDINLSNFAWQQDFGTFSYDDQLKMATDVVTGNWSSSALDLPGYGNFFLEI